MIVRLERRMRQRLIAAGIAIGVGSSYYLGSVLGLLLRLPPATPSVMWPPNSILTAALLLVPPRRWLLVLLPVVPAHLAVQLQTDWPLPLIFALFFTNCFEAVLAAGVVWLFSDAPTRFDTPRRLAIFFLAALCATLLSSFADAGAVTWFAGEPFWTVWRNRLLSNILAQLTIVPAVVGVATGLPAWIRQRSGIRIAEAATLGAGLLGLWLSHRSGELSRFPPLLAVSSQTPLALQLPFLLWAAVRFGTTGAGVSLFAATILAVWVVVHGQGPFASMSPATIVSALTLSLIVVAATMLTLATLVEERRRTQHALTERLRFEELLSRLSGAFVQVPSDRMAAGFDEWLARIGTFLELDCVRLYTLSEQDLHVAHEWSHPDSHSGPAPVVKRDYPWMQSRLLALEPVTISSVDDLPPEAVTDRQSMHVQGYKAMLVVPLVSGQRSLGALAFAAARELAWSEEVVRNLRLVAEVLANALARKQTEDALRASEGMKSSILHSLKSGVAVIDAQGCVMALNDSWAQLAPEGESVDLHVGDNLLTAARTAANPAAPRYAEVAAGISSVLEGARPRFICEYTTQSGAEARWWSLVAVPLARPEGGAVVTRADVTDLRRAELDVQRSRQELAHVGRVSTVGELTASLAHQLYQPLTAIMTNAQVARRLLDALPQDLPLLRAILMDIVNDDRRASDIIKRLRDLLRKGEPEMARVDLASTIREVADLLSSEAIIKQVSLSLDLDRDPVVVLGDRVQLQQVMLNLLHNAMEAMGDRRDGETVVSVRCRRTDTNAAHVIVRDTGPGLHEGAEDLVFEPFYTTKRHGMGMGLSIVRSIVESHGGSIKAANDGGAVFEITLPLAVEHHLT